jgi:hypothetical protein
MVARSDRNFVRSDRETYRRVVIDGFREALYSSCLAAVTDVRRLAPAALNPPCALPFLKRRHPQDGPRAGTG